MSLNKQNNQKEEQMSTPLNTSYQFYQAVNFSKMQKRKRDREWKKFCNDYGLTTHQFERLVGMDSETDIFFITGINFIPTGRISKTPESIEVIYYKDNKLYKGNIEGYAYGSGSERKYIYLIDFELFNTNFQITS